MQDLNLYLIEFYATDGAIKFAWLSACSDSEARTLVATAKQDRKGKPLNFAEVIKCDEHAKVTPLGDGIEPHFATSIPLRFVQ